MVVHAVVVIRPLNAHPCKAGTGCAEFSPDRAHDQSPNTERRDVFSELYEG